MNDKLQMLSFNLRNNSILKPLILIPGMMCDARLFKPQMSVIHGETIIISSITSHDTMFDLARQVLQNAPPEFILGGLSMGGIVAMEVLRQAPERISGLILMDTNPLAEIKEVQLRRQPQIEKAQAGNLIDVMRDEMIPNYFSGSQNNQELFDLCLDMALSLGPEVFIKQSISLRDRPDQTETLKKYKGPTLIMHGEYDKLCPSSRHELMYQLMPQAHYEVIKNAGHLPTVERPEDTNNVLKEWLRTM